MVNSWSLELAHAQNKLQSRVSIDAQNERIETILMELEGLANVVFSYPSKLVQTESITSIHANDDKLESVLLNVLGPNITFVERGSYIIIQSEKSSTHKKKEVQLSGILVDATTGEKIADATIYDVNTFRSTNSGSNGAYDLKLRKSREYSEISISKQHYQDTIIRIYANDSFPLSIKLKPLDEIEPEVLFSLADTSSMVLRLVNQEGINNMYNVSLYEKRFFQLSFLPMLGTNKRLSGKVTNSMSLNILGGFASSLKGVEVGGIFNIERHRVQGMQIAGLANMVGGVTEGLQIAGFSNINKLSVRGVQLAGFSNNTNGEHIGLQATGFVNYTYQLKGAQLSGFANIASSEAEGHQIAGILNFSLNHTGVQTAGIMNMCAKSMEGIQLAGLTNYTGSVRGLQLSALANVALRQCNGVQMSALLNYTGKLNGLQIGLINVCDTVESGANIGLLNFVRKGIRKIQFNYSESIPLNLLFKTGTNEFYNILAAGYLRDSIYLFGYGIGSQHLYNNGILRGTEIQFNAVQKFGYSESSLNLLTHITPFIGFQFKKLASLTAGPVLNIYYSHSLDSNAEFDDFEVLSTPFYNVIDGDGRLQMSLGFRTAITF
jgi:hypothetical protein